MQKGAHSSRFTNFFILVALLLSIVVIAHILQVDAGMGMSGAINSKYPSLTIEPPDQAYKLGGVMSFPSSASPAFYITSNNLSGDAKITLYKTSEQNLLNYLLHDSKTIQKEKDISVSDFPKVTELTQRVKSGYDNKVLVSLPISDVKGIWYITVELGGAKENAYIVKSSIGAVVIEAKDKYLFWAQDVKTHKSIPNVKIEAYSLLDTRSSKGSVVTSTDGTGEIPFDAMVDVALASLDGDYALIPINLDQLNYSSDYMKYPTFDGRYQKGTYYLFTDRPIYKPGDKMYFKAVVRDMHGEGYLVPDQPVKIYIDKGYEGEPLFEKTYTVSDMGTLDGEFVLPKDIKTGYHYLTISLPASDKRVGYDESSVYFNVEEYRKPEYELSLTTSPKMIVQADETIQAIVTGTYFSGQSMSGTPVKYTVTMSDYYEYGYMRDLSGEQDGDNVNIPDYLLWGDEILSGVVNLDSSGVGVIDINPDNFKVKPKKNSIITISASLDDGSANVSSRYQNLLIYSADVTLYRKSDDNFSILQAGGNTDVKYVIKSNDKEKPAKDIDMTYVVTHHDWVKTGDIDDYGLDTYKEVKKEVKKVKNIRVSSRDFGSFNTSFPIAKAGSYEVVLIAKDGSGRTNERTDWVWVSEKGSYIRSSYDAGANITIKADKQKYQFDDDASLSLSVPYESGNVLLVYGKNVAIGYDVLDVASYESSGRMKLTEAYAPRLAVVAYGTLDKNLLRAGTYLYFDTSSKKVNVYLKTDKEKYLPKDVVSVSIKTADKNNVGIPSEVAVWAIDKALFELKDPNVGQIFDEFWDSDAANRFGYDFGGAAYAFETSYSFKNINFYDMGGGGGGCFTGDTKVLMADGKTKDIGEVRVGDKVLTRSDKSKELVVDEVTATHEVREMGYLVINSDLKVTPNHIIFVNGSWKRAGDVQMGDLLVDTNGKEIAVARIDLVREDVKVYNLTTKTNHTYFADGIFVHNQKGDSARSVFKDTAYWNPNIKTSSDGTANVSFTLPDNLTTWVVQGVAVSTGTSVGSKSEEIIVTKDTIIRPKLPNILRVGDKAKIYASASNYLSKSSTFDYKLEAKGLKIAKPQGEVVLGAQETKDVSWEVEAVTPVSSLTLRFSLIAKDNKESSDIVEQKISVKEDVFVETDTKFAMGSNSYDFSIPQNIDLKKSKSSITLSSNIFATLGDSVGYLIGYPYSCTEQSASRLQGLMIAKRNPEVLARTDYKESELDVMIEDSIKRLENLQKPSGGYSFWTGSHEDAYVTMYAVLTLRELEVMGYKVNADKVRYAVDFLNRDKAYLRIGDRAGKDKQLNDNEVAMIAMRTLYELSYKDSTTTSATINMWASALDASKKTLGQTIYWSEDNWARFGSKDASTGLVLQALMKSGYWKASDEAMKVARYLIESRKKEYFSNTFGTVQAVRALFEMKSAISGSGDMNYEVTLDGRSLATGKFDDKATDVIVPLDLSSFANGQNHKLNVVYKGGAGYGLLTSKWSYPYDKVKAKSSDISVVRSITNAEDPRMTIGLGDTVNVKLTVYAKDDSVKFYGAIADKLPSGMIPVNTRLKNDATMAQTDEGYWSSDFEYSAEGVVMSFYGLKKSGIEKTYQARVVSSGEFVIPPAVAELMYLPEVSAHTGTEKIIIYEKSSLPVIYQVAKSSSSILSKIFAPVQGMYSSVVDRIPPVIRDILAIISICVAVGLVIKFVRGRKKKILEQNEGAQDVQQEDKKHKVA